MQHTALLLFTLVSLGVAFIAPRIIPYNMGVNIHFTSTTEEQWQLLAQAAQLKWIRMDVMWDRIETQHGIYNFDAYDVLVQQLQTHKVRAIFILDYMNALYDNNQSPYTDAGRQAFARFAVAAVQRYANRQIIWEIYNEPNIAFFWHPKPNSKDYSLLVQVVAEAIRAVAPQEVIVAPALSQLTNESLTFLEQCFQNGVLEHIDAVTVHPYRPTYPETVIYDYTILRNLIIKYAPPGKYLPIIAGEWGYSELYPHQNLTMQGKTVAREFLTNFANGIDLTIWYDWMDDGTDPKELEHHFGLLFHDGTKKPSFVAVQTLVSQLQGYYFVKSLPVPNNTTYAQLYSNMQMEQVLVAWTYQYDATYVLATGKPNSCYNAVDYLNTKTTVLCANDQGMLTLPMSNAPLYVKQK